MSRFSLAHTHVLTLMRGFLQAAKGMVQDAVDLALMEGLHGHSRAAAMRLPEKQ